jgi:hypothetical protein
LRATPHASHHRLRAAQKLIQQTGQPAQLELFPKSDVVQAFVVLQYASDLPDAALCGTMALNEAYEISEDQKNQSKKISSSGPFCPASKPNWTPFLSGWAGCPTRNSPSYRSQQEQLEREPVLPQFDRKFK